MSAICPTCKRIVREGWERCPFCNTQLKSSNPNTPNDVLDKMEVLIMRAIYPPDCYSISVTFKKKNLPLIKRALEPLGYRLRFPHRSSSNPQGWWEPYVKPLPTWDVYTPARYTMSLGRLKARPLPPKLTTPLEKGRFTGIIIGEGFLGYIIRKPRIDACINVSMLERQPIDYLTEMIGLKTYKYRYKPEVYCYYLMTTGLRSYMLINYIQDDLLGKRREVAKFIVKHGYTIKPETLEEYKTWFRPKHTRVRVPTEASPEKITWTEAYLIPPPERP